MTLVRYHPYALCLQCDIQSIVFRTGDVRPAAGGCRCERLQKRKLAMIRETGVRRTLLVVLAFNALSQIGGAIGLLAGAHPPLSLLSSTPFADYTLPALMLGIITGGGSLAAVLLVARAGRLTGDVAGIVSGGITAGWIVGEVLLWKESLLGFLSVPLQVLYFVTGLLAAGLAAWLWLADWERAHPHTSQRRHGVA
jgi:hypothetical protein